MYIVCVTVHVTPEHVQSFIEATLENARQSRLTEPGNVRFDVLQAEADPAQFFLYEVYREKEDFARHQQTAHYLSGKRPSPPGWPSPARASATLSVFPSRPRLVGVSWKSVRWFESSSVRWFTGLNRLNNSTDSMDERKAFVRRSRVR